MSNLVAKVREVLGSIPADVAAPADLSAIKENLMPRAQRYKLNLPLRYRVSGEPTWHRGTTENISRSGLLFQAEEGVVPKGKLEITLVLPAEIGGLSAAEVFCKGEVVRTISEAGELPHPALAAKILQYHFHHGSHADA